MMDAKNLLRLLHDAEALKKVMRHSWLSDGRRESAAEHSWRVSLMAILFSDRLEGEIDRYKALRMAVVHDLVEAYAGDVPAFEQQRRKEQRTSEREEMQRLKEKYGGPEVDELFSLWEEYETGESAEAKFVKALDKLEVRLQHNEADISTWNDVEFPRSLFSATAYCEHDGFLAEMNRLIMGESERKIERESERDLEAVRREAEDMQEESR